MNNIDNIIKKVEWDPKKQKIKITRKVKIYIT